MICLKLVEDFEEFGSVNREHIEQAHQLGTYLLVCPLIKYEWFMDNCGIIISSPHLETHLWWGGAPYEPRPSYVFKNTLFIDGEYTRLLVM